MVSRSQYPWNQNAMTVHQMTLFLEKNVKSFYGEVPVRPLAETEDLSPTPDCLVAFGHIPGPVFEPLPGGWQP